MLHMKIFIVLYPGRPSIEWNILNRELFPKGKDADPSFKKDAEWEKHTHKESQPGS